MCVLQGIRRRILSIFEQKGSTPLPWVTVVALFSSMFANGVTIQMFLAFLPDMVKSFGISDEDAGYYIGLLASSLHFGRFLSSYLWGWLCDRIGRRKVLLWSIALMSVFTLAFGFAKSFAVAFILRFFTGVSSGISGTAKAVVTEICDETNQALGMSLVGAAWNTGLIFGPAIGGYLARPADKYGVFEKGGLFDNYPFLFSCLINTAILVLSFVLILFVFPETLASLSKKTEVSMESVAPRNNEHASGETGDGNPSLIKHGLSKSCPGNINCTSTMAPSQPSSEKSDRTGRKRVNSSRSLLSPVSVSILPTHIDHLDDFGVYGSVSLLQIADTTVKQQASELPLAGSKNVGVCVRIMKSFKESKLAAILKQRNVRYCIGLYTIFASATICEHEVYSMWAASGRHLGGLDFDTNDLGFTLMFVGIGTVLTSFIIYPQLSKCFGHMKVQIIMNYVAIFSIIVCPAINILYSSRASLTTMVIVVLTIQRISQGCCFTGQFIFLGNSVTSDVRCSVHGLAMTSACAARTIAPIIAGSIFSWSVSSGYSFPFNEKCVFIFIGVQFWVALVVTCCLEQDIVEKRRD